MIGALLNRTVTIVTTSAGAVDRYGDPTHDETTVDVVGYLEQEQTSEAGTDDSVTSERWLLVVPAGTAVTADDRVEVDGTSYQVDGNPWPVHNPRTGGVHHVEARLRRTS